MTITKDMLQSVMTPFVHGYQFVDELQCCVDKLNRLGFTKEGLAMLVAQCGHESGGFYRLEENLNYRATTLMRVWPRHFKTLDVAKQYTNKPVDLAKIVYGNRLGNRANTDDGWRYRGRGFIQLTGLANYMLYNRVVSEDIVVKPQLAKKPLVAWEIAIAYFDFTSRGDKDVIEYANAGDVKTVTRMINGGYHGIKDRKRRYKLALDALNSNTTTPPMVLRVGSRGKAVVTLQEALGLTPADGIYGKQTAKAVKAFQRKAKLCVDGIAGVMTLEKLYKEIE